MRVATPADDAYMYPDAVIACGKPQLEDDKFDTLLNPSVIFEILSPSTRSIDKGRKFFFYQEIPSLQEYIIVDTQKRFMELARKQLSGGWKFETIKDSSSTAYSSVLSILIYRLKIFIQILDYNYLLIDNHLKILSSR